MTQANDHDADGDDSDNADGGNNKSGKRSSPPGIDVLGEAKTDRLTIGIIS